MRRSLRIKYVRATTKANGQRFVYYVRPGFKRVRLPDLPENHPAFLAAYAEASRAAEREPSRREPGEEGTIAALCASYRRSMAFRSLRGSTRKARSYILEKIVAKAGGALIADLAPRHIRRDLSTLTPHAANNRLKAWRALTRHAIELEQIESDPAQAVKNAKTGSEGFYCWTDAEIIQFRNRHPSGSPARLAFEVALWTGARRGDLVQLGRQHLSNGSLTYVSKKTRVEVCIPILPEVQAEIDQMPADQMLFVPIIYDKPATHESFGKWFKTRCREAGLGDQCQIHGLRKARARIMAEEGASTHTIAAWGGWKTLAEVAHYTEAADRRKLTHARTEQKQKSHNRKGRVVTFREKPNKIKGWS